MIRNVLRTALIVALLPTLGFAQDKTEATAQALNGFDAQIEKAMSDLLVPGTAVGIVRGGKLVWAKGFGHRDVATKKPVTPQTIFAIGSASKAFTTFTMAKLVDEGRMEWDKPAATYLPGLRLHDEYATSHITPRDMVTHRSGLPRHDLAWYNNTELDVAGIAIRLGEFRPNRELRQTFQYNNLMFATAGHLVSRLTNKPWEDAVREMIFAPLGMRSSNFSVTESQKSPDHALPYGEAKDTLRVLSFRNITNIAPAGSINSNIEDMAKWVALQLSDGTFEGKRVINKPTLNEMHTPQMVIASYPTEPMISPSSYGLGWFVDTYRGHYRVHHGGNIDGFSALVSFFPHDDVGIVVLTNKNGTPLPELTVRHIADRLFDLKPRDWYTEAAGRRRIQLAQARESTERSKAERVAGTKPAHALTDYAGEYGHPGYGLVRVTHKPGTDGGQLSFRFNNIETPLEHWHYEVFNGLENPGDRTFNNFKVVFITDRDGQVAGLEATMDANVEPIVFPRRPDPQLADAKYLQKFVGKYTLGTNPVQVALIGNRLTATLVGQPTYDLIPMRNNTFELKTLKGYRVQFVLDETGKVKEAVFKQPNGIFPAKRAE